MTAPSWLTGTFAAMMLAVAAYCLVRLGVAWRSRRPTELDSDGVHAVMGVAMAGMLVTGLRTLPAGAWAAVFGISAGWFGWQAVRTRRGGQRSPWRCAHPLPHVIESAAMVYMLAAIRGSSTLALALVVFSAGYGVWLSDRLTGPVTAVAGTWHKIAMVVTMGYMLVLMV